MGVDDELGNIDHKFAVIDEVSELYDNLIRELETTKKFMNEREPKDDKNDSWKQKYDLKNLKALDYQPSKPKTESLSDENGSDL